MKYFNEFLIEAYSDAMKQKIDSKFLTKIGRALSKHGVGVQKSEFVQIPKRNFSFKNCYEKSNGEEAFVVCVNTAKDYVSVICIENSYGELEAYYLIDKNEMLSYDGATARVDDVKKEHNLFFVVVSQDNIKGKRDARAASKGDDSLLATHARVADRMIVQDINKQLRSIGVSLAGMKFTQNREGITVGLKYDKLPKNLDRVVYGAMIVKCKDNKYHMVLTISYHDRSEMVIDYFNAHVKVLDVVKGEFDDLIDTTETWAAALKTAKKMFEIFYKYDIEKFDEVKQMLASK